MVTEMRTKRSDSTVIPSIVLVITPRHLSSFTRAIAVAGLLAIQIDAITIATAHLQSLGYGLIQASRLVDDRRPTTIVHSANVKQAMPVVCATSPLKRGLSS
eukprot:767895-Hanusia_phi.AAC.16